MSVMNTFKSCTAIALALPVALSLATAASGQGIPKVERTFADGSSVGFYGQINKGFLSYDDGEETEEYDLIDNDNSSTRFGLTYDRPLTPGWELGSRVEFEYQPFNTGQANINDDNADFDFTLKNNLRKAEFTFASGSIGEFTLGQGSMASDGAAEVDLSGTGVIAYSSVGDSAGGQLFRQSDDVLTDIAVGSAFSNYDGLSRKMRVRYDSPDFSGFGVAVSYGQDALNDDETDLYDVAATYGNSFGSVDLEAKAAYAWKGSDTDIVSGSASVLHAPTGLNFTLAGGQEDDGDKTGSYGYAKIGWKADLLSVGSSAFGIDWYKGSDIATEDSDSESYGLAYVQTFERINTEFWLTYREYDYDDDDSNYHKGKAAFTGLRFKW